MSGIINHLAKSVLGYVFTMLVILISRPILSKITPEDPKLALAIESSVFCILYCSIYKLTKVQAAETSKNDQVVNHSTWPQAIGQGIWILSGYSFIANDYSPGYAVKALLIGTTIIALLEYWGQRIITKRVEKLKHNKKKVSPYLSSIIVKGIEANALLSSLAVNKCIDDGPQTRQVLISVLDKNDWVISFPDGVSIDMFLDIMTNLFWDNSDGSNIGMTGYYRSIEGLFDDKLTMIKYDEHGDFIMVNSSGVNYEMIVTKKRKLFFTHLNSSFVPAAETKLQFEPFDIEYTVRHTQQYKSIRIKDDFLQM